jgi:hypothetical protein
VPSSLTSVVVAGLALGLTLTASACSSPSPFGACTEELRVRLTPQDTAVAEGSAFSATAALSSCGGKQELEDSFTFQSSDVSVAAVDSASGRVTAIGSGRADINVVGERYGPVGRILVTVLP